MCVNSIPIRLLFDCAHPAIDRKLVVLHPKPACMD